MDKESLYNIDNFIGVFDNFYNDQICDQLINYYNVVKSTGQIYTRQDEEGSDKFYKDDTSTFNITPTDATCEMWHEPGQLLMTTFWEKIFKLYQDEYDVLKMVKSKKVAYLKIQETKPGQGYHMWHYETESLLTAPRLLAFSFYLNDVDEGGETEFLYQKKRIKAKRNRFALFPAHFTHPHRGNPPISNTKYMVAGHVLMC